MYDLYLEGKSYQAIANIYNKEKILGKTNWKGSTIGKIMTNELYKGDYLQGKKTKKPTYYEIEADEQLEDVGFIPNGDYEKVLRLIVLSDSKRYDDKTLRLGVITLDMESAILSRIGKTKEATNELCHI